MAQKMTVSFEDDLDPDREAVETVRFGVNGQDYEIDLCQENLDHFHDVLAEFVAAARKVHASDRRPVRKPKPARPTMSLEQQQAIREWARGQGLPIKDRGRIPQDIIAQFNDAA